mgnify:CR=1 FL=1
MQYGGEMGIVRTWPAAIQRPFGLDHISHAWLEGSWHRLGGGGFIGEISSLSAPYIHLTPRVSATAVSAAVRRWTSKGGRMCRIIRAPRSRVEEEGLGGFDGLEGSAGACALGRLVGMHEQRRGSVGLPDLSGGGAPFELEDCIRLAVACEYLCDALLTTHRALLRPALRRSSSLCHRLARRHPDAIAIAASFWKKANLVRDSGRFDVIISPPADAVEVGSE